MQRVKTVQHRQNFVIEPIKCNLGVTNANDIIRVLMSKVSKKCRMMIGCMGSVLTNSTFLIDIRLYTAITSYNSSMSSVCGCCNTFAVTVNFFRRTDTVQAMSSIGWSTEDGVKSKLF